MVEFLYELSYRLHLSQNTTQLSVYLLDRVNTKLKIPQYDQ